MNPISLSCTLDILIINSAPPTLTVTSSDGTTYRHADLLDGFAIGHQNGARLLVKAGEGLEQVLVQSLGAWQQDGSVVLVHPDVEITDKLLANERVQGS